MSGGQKARVSLARAVYAQREIILMDDPISALDANVKKKIFTNVFVGDLKDKTRVLVTHAVDFLHMVDTVICLKDGEVVLTGSYESIKEDPYLQEIMKIHKSHKKEQEQMQVDSSDRKSEEGEFESFPDNQGSLEAENEEEPDLFEILTGSVHPDENVN